jgi:hypothetical protein
MEFMHKSLTFIPLPWIGAMLLFTAPASADDINSPATWKTGYQELSRLGSGFVVWESKRTGHWRIWRINLDGSGLRQISPEDDREHSCPHISPDGRHVVYLSHLPSKGETGSMHLIRADGTDNRILVPEARSYGGDRAAVWLSDHELLYIGGDQITSRIDIRTGSSTPLLKEAMPDQDWGTGWLMNPTLTHATTGVPTFSPFDARSRIISPRAKQGGCEPYFSHDGVWGFWVGGGGGPINRYRLATGEISPILKKDDERMPRERDYLYFPMVSRCGRLLAFAASPEQHDHDTSDYDIFVARIDPKTLELLGRPVRYSFDKATDRYPDAFLSGRAVADARRAAPTRGSSATNKAIPPQRTYPRGSWPSDRSGLVFLWETGSKPNLVRDPATGKERTYPLRARGRARMDHDYALRLTGGAYVAQGVDQPLLAACRKTNALTIETTLLPDQREQAGPARIVTSSTDAGTRNFTLGQAGGQLILRLRTPETGENGTNPEVQLCSLSTEEPTHIVVTYSPGRLVCYRNGEQVLETDRLRGDFSNWTLQHLLFGDEWNGDRGWAGTLEGIALYNRSMSAAEAKANFTAYQARRLARKPVPRIEVEARLVARSKVPTLKEIQPYREALVIYEYAVAKVLQGKRQLPQRIRVAHWALLDGAGTGIERVDEKASARLILEPFDANKQLESTYRSDTLPDDFDMPLFYDAAG